MAAAVTSYIPSTLMPEFVLGCMSGTGRRPAGYRSRLCSRKDCGMSATTSPRKDPFAAAAEGTAAAERDIQTEMDRKEKARAKGGAKEKGAKGAMQAGARRSPEPPFPKQHLIKPG